MKLNGKVGMVTGGAKGIGKAFCNALLNEGMKVSICDINENVGKNFPEDILEDQKNKVIFCKCDVSSESEFRAAFDKTIKTFGRIDLLINNAGILNEHEWKRVIDVNFVGVINGIHLAFEYMGIDKGGCGGTVINTGSNAAFEPIPLAPVYSGCKHGVIGLTRNYGTDYHFKKTGVTVSSVCPGPVDTELFHEFPAMSVDEKLAEEHNKRVKPIKPEEVAKAMLQLLYDDKNGALLRVDADGMRYV